MDDAIPQSRLEQVDFFISRRGANAATAIEVADVLKEAGYSVIVQDYDMAPGTNIVLAMHEALKRCRHLIVLLTADYDASAYTIIEFTNFIMAQAKAAGTRRLILFQVDDSEPDGVFAAIAFVSLRGVTEADKRRKIILDAAEGRTVSSPRRPKVFEGVPPRDLNFVGRDDSLARLHDWFMGSEKSDAVTRVAIHGLGGIGKTSLAAEYAYRFGGAYAGVWWAPAAKPEDLIGSLARLAVVLGVPRARDLDDVSIVRTAFSKLAEPRRPWLLIYDNVERPQKVREFIPSLGTRVIFTTRWPDWGGLAADLAVGVLSRDDAVKFLLDRTRSRDTAGAAGLAQKLGDLPVALDHAGAFIRLTNITFEDYGKELDARIAESPEGTAYPASVGATFSIAIDKAIADSSAAEKLLSYIAFLPPERIQFVQLAEFAQSKKIADKDFERALFGLASVSLIEHQSTPAGVRVISVHRLVQAAMRNRLAAGKASHATGDIVREVSKSSMSRGYETEPIPAGDHPPRPRLALACGVIGHRENRIPAAARTKVAAEARLVLEALVRELEGTFVRHRDIFAPDRPLLSVVSALVEGGDRIVAKAALDAEVTIDVALPYGIAKFEQEMTSPEHRAEFHGLLGQARSILTLEGADDPAQAHQIAGETIVGQSDVLLAVWDGQVSDAAGSTAATVAVAIRAGIPVIVIDAGGLSPPKLMRQATRSIRGEPNDLRSLPMRDFEAELPNVLDMLVRPPEEPAERRALSRYLGERSRKFKHVDYAALMVLFASQRIRWRRGSAERPDAMAREYVAMAAALAPGSSPGRTDDAARAYGWADSLGVQLGNVYRSSFVRNFTALAIAGMLIGGAIVFDRFAPALLTALTLVLVATFVNSQVARRAEWRIRWLETREIADRLRAAMLLWALGIRLPTDLPSGAQPWTSWYANAFVRAQGLRSGSLDMDGLAAAQSVTLSWLLDQVMYHQINEVRMQRLDRRLDRTSTILFLTATLSVAAFVGIYLAAMVFGFNISGFGREAFLGRAVIGAIIAMLGTAGATYGIRFVGDFSGIAHRSGNSADEFKRLIDDLAEAKPDIARLRSKVKKAADVILSDVADRGSAAIREGRKLSLPA
jgi:hypothetical protein